MKKALPLAVFALSAVWLAITGNLVGDFRIDEAHKISETYYLRLIERGDFSNPAWLASPIERANPPIGKVIFGLAMQARGVPLPVDASFATQPDPRGSPARLRSALAPVRVVSLIATSATAALACVLAGPVASILFMGSFLARTYGTAGVFDALLTLFVVAAAVPVAFKVTWPRTVSAACLAALAVDTRLSGVIALIGVIVLVRDWRKALAAVAICFVVATALNPVCWVPGPEPLVFGRYAMMIRDANAVLTSTGEHQLRPIEKFEFLSEYAFGDLIGLLTLLGLPFAIRRVPRSIGWWCLAVVITLTAWLPVGYPRYVLLAIPALAIAADYGYRQLLVAGGHFVARWRRKA